MCLREVRTPGQAERADRPGQAAEVASEDIKTVNMGFSTYRAQPRDLQGEVNFRQDEFVEIKHLKFVKKLDQFCGRF